MRIIIYGLNFYPEMIGIGKYNTEMADWLIKKGHKVHVICAPPYYPSWTIKDGYSSWRYSHQSEKGLSVTRCPIWIPKAPAGLKRILHLISFAVSSLPLIIWYSIFWKPDLIFTLEPPIFCLPGTILVSKLFNVKVWLHVQDFELDAGFNLGLIPNLKILKKTIFWLESFILRQVDNISTISQEMLRLLVNAKGVKSQQCCLFPNWVDTQAIVPLQEDSCFRKELGLSSEQIVCLYAGNLGAKQGLDVLVKAAQLLEDQSNITFVIAGDGPMRETLIERARGLSNIRFLDLQPQERFNSLLNLANIHLLPQSGETNDLFFPSKVKAMFASGRPVIATAHMGTQLAQVITGCGLVTAPGDAVQLSEAIQFLSKDLTLSQYLGNEARTYAIKHWSQKSVLSNIEQKFLDLMKHDSCVSVSLSADEPQG